MDEQSVPPTPQQPATTGTVIQVPNPRTFFERFKLMFKAGAIFIISLILLIPTTWIFDVINEREYRRNDVVREVSGKWAGQQNISAPVLTIPYKEYVHDDKGKVLFWKRSMTYFLPDDYTAACDIQTQLRHRSIYNVPVYTTTIKANGKFGAINFSALNVKDDDILWNEASVFINMWDPYGLVEQSYCRWNDTTSVFELGLPANFRSAGAIHTRVPVTKETLKKGYEFAYQLTVKGTEKLTMTPLAKQNTITMRSAWSSPSFDGYILPYENTVNDSGFTATWKTSDFKSSVPHQWTENNSKSADGFTVDRLYGAAGCSTTLVFGATDYQVTTRAVKYAIMVIGLTFMMFFFIEVLARKSVHPFQYILIGIALVIFYSLLLSFSEHIDFNYSYIIASVMTIGLVALYSSAILHDKKFAALIGATLVLIYGFIFTILKLEDYSLMVGSLGIFTALSIVMYFSRKVDWSRSKV